MNTDSPQFGMYWHGFRTVYWIAAVAAITAVVVLALSGQPAHALRFLALVTPAFVFLALVDVPALFGVSLLIANIFAAIGWIWDLSARVFFYDEALHAFFGFAATAVFGHWIYRSMRSEFERHRWLLFLAVFTFGLALGGAWEIYEWMQARWNGPFEPVSRTDTVSDLALDAAGALVAAWMVGLSYRREALQSRNA